MLTIWQKQPGKEARFAGFNDHMSHLPSLYFFGLFLLKVLAVFVNDAVTYLIWNGNKCSHTVQQFFRIAATSKVLVTANLFLNCLPISLNK